MVVEEYMKPTLRLLPVLTGLFCALYVGMVSASDLRVPKKPITTTEEPKEPVKPVSESALPTQIYQSKQRFKKIPSVFINGKRVKSMLEENMGQSLGSRNKNKVFNYNTVRDITIFTHTPRIGSSSAPVKIIEMTDLSCLQCQPLMKIADSIYEKYHQQVQLLHIHLPVDLYNSTNPAAFYGQMAQKENVFWNYRKNLYKLKKVNDNAFVDSLIDSNLSFNDIRKLSRSGARQFYKELDADAQMAKRLGEMKPPVLFVNGIRVSPNATEDDVDRLVRFAIKQAGALLPEEQEKKEKAAYGKL